MKKLLSTFLSVLLILSVCPMELFTVPASAETTSGTCGTKRSIHESTLPIQYI